jgi:integral membrane protein
MGLFEGASFLLLLGVAMPLKYFMGQPLAVRITGPIHGALFLWLCWLVLEVVAERDWSKVKGLAVILAALLPLGPWLIDGWLKREQAAMAAEKS